MPPKSPQTSLRLTLAALFILCLDVALGVATSYGETVFSERLFDFEVTYNVVYATGAVENPATGEQSEINLALDVYRPVGDNLPSLLPGMTLIHGGGFTGGNKIHMEGYAEDFARHGYVATSIRYRLEGDNPVGGDAVAAAIEDGTEAVRWMRDNAPTLNIDPTRIGIGGYSAGAITSLFVGVQDFPGADVSVILSLAGGLYGWEEALIDPTDPSVYIAHGIQDTVVPWNPQATELAAELDEKGVPYMFPQLQGTHDMNTVVFDELPNGKPVHDDWIDFFYSEMNLQSLVVPEPSSATLVFSGIFGAAVVWRRRRP